MDKIKEFIAKNKKLVIIGGSALALLVVVGIVLALVLGGSKLADINGCTVEIKTEGGMALEGIGVYIYEAADKKEMVSYAKTNETGTVAFTETIPAGSVVVLEDVPAGYIVAENYPVIGAEMQITLSAELLQEMTDIKLGGIMFDFTVTDTDGTEHTLSELLKEKKAVVLNLWYTNCQPCRMEFPYLQQAYETYSSDIALLALNPVSEDDEAAVADYKTETGLTFPMAKCDAGWADLISGIAYPTTIVIDRYGMVALIHVGSIDNSKTFKDAFAYFAAEDYVQTTVEAISSLAVENGPEQGTQENPFELNGVTAFDVTADAGQTVYYNLYQVSDMELSVSSENLKITYGETEYMPAEGVVTVAIGTKSPMIPALLGFTNTGSATESYQVTLSAPKGTSENPIVLELGDFTAVLTEGNAQGVYYTYNVAEKGNFVITVKQVPENTEYSIALNNLTASKYLTMAENGTKDSDGNMTLTVAAAVDDKLQVIISALPDSNNVYPAASIGLNAAINKESTTTQSGSSGNSSSGKPNTNGTLVNPNDPIEIGGTLKFDAENIGVGEMKLYHVYRVSGTTLQIKDADAYVIYNNKTYTPNSKGYIYISMKTDGPSVPVVLKIGNSGSTEKTISVKFYYPAGTRENPHDYTLDEAVTTESKKGNDQGVYYTYKTSKAGKFTIEFVSYTAGVTCGITVTTQGTYPRQETVISTEGNSVTIDMAAGEEVEIIISVYPDEGYSYPQATIVTQASFR